MVEPGACDKCIGCIGNYAGQDLYQPALVHPEFGAIWDLLLDHSLTHPNCRCHVTVTATINWDKMPEFQKLAETINSEQVLPKGTEVISVTLPVGELDLSTVSEMRSELGSLTGKVDELEQKSSKTELTMRQEIRTLNLLLMLTKRATGNESLDNAINIMQNAMQVALRLRMALIALTAASGPWGWLYAGANVAAAAIMTSDLVISIGE
jgi:hypothetical protein